VTDSASQTRPGTVGEALLHEKEAGRAGPSRETPAPRGVDLSAIPFAEMVREIIRRLGDDPHREGLVRTPDRVVESLHFLTEGYQKTADEVVGEGLFAECHRNMVLVKNIEMYSLCEHHLLPFFGKVHVAYIPGSHILGLSKVARLVDVFARRLQVQERMTEEIAQSLWDVAEPEGVGVVVEAHHLCMMMRGVEKQNSSTITSAVRGSFLKDGRTRDEFLRLCMSAHHPLG
jgi:GTP cyclohydrolase IA